MNVLSSVSSAAALLVSALTVHLLLTPSVVVGQLYATCVIAPYSGVGAVQGTINLTQPTTTLSSVANANTVLTVNLSGFNTSSGNTLHGFHVHASGNLGQQCNASLGHFNPTNMTHGAPSAVIRHVGDLGNINVTADGTVVTTITDREVSLINPYSVLGLAIVVHAMQDDLGLGNFSDSNTTGHAGARLGCCTIVPTGSNFLTLGVSSNILTNQRSTLAVLLIAFVTTLFARYI